MIREGNIVWIDSLANIARQQDEEAKTKESKIKAEDLVTRIVYVQNVTAQEIQTTLRSYLSPRGQLQVNPAVNALIVQDTESRIASFTQLVRELDLEVPQVQIEARIVQADTSYSRSLGIVWGFSNLNTTNTGVVANVRGQPSTSTDPFGGQTSQFMVNLPAAVSGLPTVPGVGFTFGKANGFLLDMRLTAGELLGLTKVIAAPDHVSPRDTDHVRGRESGAAGHPADHVTRSEGDREEYTSESQGHEERRGCPKQSGRAQHRQAGSEHPSGGPRWRDDGDRRDLRG